MTLNINSLLHLPDSVADLGPLWSSSCFPFENANGDLLKLINESQNVDMQIINAINISKLPLMTQMVSPNSIANAFIKRLLQTGHALSCVVLGKGYSKLLSEDLLELLQMKTGYLYEVSKKFIHSRAMLHSTIHHSQDYARVTHHNSYTVLFVDDQMFIMDLSSGFSHTLIMKVTNYQFVAL